MNTANPFHFKGIKKIPKIFFNQIKNLTLSNTSFPDGVEKPHEVFKDLGIEYLGDWIMLKKLLAVFEIKKNIEGLTTQQKIISLVIFPIICIMWWGLCIKDLFKNVWWN